MVEIGRSCKSKALLPQRTQRNAEKTMNSFEKLLSFLDELEKKHIYFSLGRFRSEAIMVRVDVPGQRWEIEFFADGNVEVEVFTSGGANVGLEGEESLERLFKNFSD